MDDKDPGWCRVTDMALSSSSGMDNTMAQVGKLRSLRSVTLQWQHGPQMPTRMQPRLQAPVCPLVAAWTMNVNMDPSSNKARDPEMTFSSNLGPDDTMSHEWQEDHPPQPVSHRLHIFDSTSFHSTWTIPLLFLPRFSTTHFAHHNGSLLALGKPLDVYPPAQTGLWVAVTFRSEMPSDRLGMSSCQ